MHFESTVALCRHKAKRRPYCYLRPWTLAQQSLTQLSWTQLFCLRTRLHMHALSFICRSLSITAMFLEPDHLQQLKMPLQLAGSAGLWSTLHYIISKEVVLQKAVKGIWFHPPLAHSAQSPAHRVFPLWSSGVNHRIKCTYYSSKMILFFMRSNIKSCQISRSPYCKNQKQ